MPETILAAAPTIRLAVFFAVLAAMASREVAAPRRRGAISRLIRQTSKPARVVVDTIIPRLSFPVIAVGLGAMAEERCWRLLRLDRHIMKKEPAE